MLQRLSAARNGQAGESVRRVTAPSCSVQYRARNSERGRPSEPAIDRTSEGIRYTKAYPPWFLQQFPHCVHLKRKPLAYQVLGSMLSLGVQQCAVTER